MKLQQPKYFHMIYFPTISSTVESNIGLLILSPRNQEEFKTIPDMQRFFSAKS